MLEISNQMPLDRRALDVLGQVKIDPRLAGNYAKIGDRPRERSQTCSRWA